MTFAAWAARHLERQSDRLPTVTIISASPQIAGRAAATQPDPPDASPTGILGYTGTASQLSEAGRDALTAKLDEERYTERLAEFTARYGSLVAAQVLTAWTDIERDIRDQIADAILAAKGTDPRFAEGWASTKDRDHAAKIARGDQ